MVGRSTVVVAHRLSTIRDVDTIAVVEKGQIVEQGSHQELMAKAGGAYATLVKLQEMARDDPRATLDREFRQKSPAVSRRRSFSSPATPDSRERLSVSRSRRSSSASEYSKLEEIDGTKDDDTISKPQSDDFYWRLVRLNAPEWPYALLGTVGSIIGGAIRPLYAVVLSSMLSVFYYSDHHKLQTSVTRNCIFFVIAAASSPLAYTLQSYFFGIVGENLTNRVRLLMFQSMLRNEVGWFDLDQNSSAHLAARLATDATNIRTALSERVSNVVQNLAVFVTACIVSLLSCWQVALVGIATLPLLIGSQVAEQSFVKGFAGDVAAAHERASVIAGEAVANVRTVAAFNAEKKVLELVESELQQPEKSSFIRGNIAGVFFGVAQFAMYSSYSLTLWYGSALVKSGQADFASVIRVFMVFLLTAMAVAETLSLSPDLVKAGSTLSSVFTIMDRKTMIEPDDQDAQQVTEMKGEIELRKVKFAYPTRPEVLIFNDLSLRVEAGKSVALVGASGSGKSSVIALIQRFYDPLSGRVLVDGKDIRQLNLRSLRKRIGLVQQEPALFATSIYENILYGREEASATEVEAAAEAANAHGFISGLPEGYKTQVGERGVQLSGGQKQRVAIARAVLKNPAILLLDEATSALDAESEKVVQEALDKLMQNRTTILVAHRLSTIRNASSIAVVQEGRIVEQGTHQKLLSTSDGAYARLIRLQQHQHQH